MAPFESLGTISYSIFIVAIALSCLISEIKRDICRKWPFFHTPVSDVSVGILPYVLYGKTRMVWLSGC